MSSAGDAPELHCAELDEGLAWFVDRLGFRLDAIGPSDAPRWARISRGELRAVLRAPSPAPRYADAAPVVLARGGASASWTRGRAGMAYRDLLPDRHAGACVAAQIRVAGGGAVPDYVHHHDVRFQMIFCRRGWVRVVYEDQGAPITLQPGDCVLQPPGIRHRVLECSAGLEVVEVTAPALHDTHVDHELELPTAHLRPEREFAGQRFVFHVAAATPASTLAPGWSARDLGLHAASAEQGRARILRAAGAPALHLPPTASHLTFAYVLAGTATAELPDGPVTLGPDDALTLRAGLPLHLGASENLELLHVELRVTPPA
jgi:mannose-6-phosphate isomerase-like protein (cupin superfamily)